MAQKYIFLSKTKNPRNCLNFIDDKCYELFLDDFFDCDKAHSGVLCNEEQVEKALKRAITELFNKF